MIERFSEAPSIRHPAAGDSATTNCQFRLLPKAAIIWSCSPPAAEASITRIHRPGIEHLRRVGTGHAPSTFLRAGIAANTRPARPGRFAHRRRSGCPFRPRPRDVVLEGASHFIPMEFPDRVMEEVRTLIGA